MQLKIIEIWRCGNMSIGHPVKSFEDIEKIIRNKLSKKDYYGKFTILMFKEKISLIEEPLKKEDIEVRESWKREKNPTKSTL